MWGRAVWTALVALVAITLVGARLPASAQAALAEGSRIGGADRYETAAQVALRAFPQGAPVAYLARANVSADALAAGALADGPVLLVPSCGTIPSPVLQALRDLAPDRVIGLGGDAAVCDELLSATGIPSARLGGSDRYATAAQVAQRAFPQGAPVVYLARGDVAADALAAGALTDGPLLLVPRSGAIPASVSQAITALGADRVIAVGGHAAVSPSVLQAAATGRQGSRIAGADRYATAVLIAQRAFPQGAPVVYLARGDVAADALAAGALTDGPVVLTRACNGLPDPAASMFAVFGTQRVVALGGRLAVCDATLDAAVAATARSGKDVMLISIDGLRPDAVTQLGDAGTPNLHRLIKEGATTANARTLYELTKTLPNHTSMVTGRAVAGPDGHGVTFNEDNGGTVHAVAGSYVASMFDVAHDHGLSTAMYAGKSKFDFLDRSWNEVNGAPDITGRDNGRDKIDHYQRDRGSLTTTSFLSHMGDGDPWDLSLVHYAAPDAAGHRHGWMSTEYLKAVRDVDGYVGRILDMVDSDPVLQRGATVLLTSDHGGTGSSHHDTALAVNHTVPYYVRGPGVTAGADLYALNSHSRVDPGTDRVDYSARPQPIRNADSANLVLDFLGMRPVPGSAINAAQDLTASREVGSVNEP